MGWSVCLLFFFLNGLYSDFFSWCHKNVRACKTPINSGEYEVCGGQGNNLRRQFHKKLEGTSKFRNWTPSWYISQIWTNFQYLFVQCLQTPTGKETTTSLGHLKDHEHTTVFFDDPLFLGLMGFLKNKYYMLKPFFIFTFALKKPQPTHCRNCIQKTPTHPINWTHTIHSQ